MVNLLVFDNNQKINDYFSFFYEKKIVDIITLDKGDKVNDQTDFSKEISYICVDVNDIFSNFKDIVTKISSKFVFKGVLLFYSGTTSKIEIKQMMDFVKDNLFVKFIFNLDIDQRLYFPYLRDLLFRNGYQENAILDNFNDIILNVDHELDKVEKLHKKLVPKRKEVFKGIEVVGQFIAGEASGGEFFDIIERNKKLLVFCSFSPSYSISLKIYDRVNYFKEQQNSDFDLEAVEENIMQLQEEVLKKSASGKAKSKNFERKSKFQLFIGVINLRTLDFEGYCLGDYQLFSSQEGLVNIGNSYSIEDFNTIKDKCRFRFKLKREEKIVLLSPGLQYNVENIDEEKQSTKSITEDLKLYQDTEDLLNGLFYEVSKGKKDLSEFYSYDGLALVFEVNKNVIFQA